jgi:hypothetical protein
MGIDNSRAAQSEFRLTLALIFLACGSEGVDRRVGAEAVRRRRLQHNKKEWEEDAPTESDRYGGDLGRTLGFPVRAGPAHHPQRSVPC